MALEEEPSEVNPEIDDLWKNGKYIDALKKQANILNRRRGQYSIWTAEKDIITALSIVEEGNIFLDLPSFVYSGERSMNMNAPLGE